MQDSGVIATAETAADIRQRSAGQLARQIHSDLAWPRDPACAPSGVQFAQFEFVEFSGFLLDFLDRDPPVQNGTPAVDRFFGHTRR